MALSVIMDGKSRDSKALSRSDELLYAIYEESSRIFAYIKQSSTLAHTFVNIHSSQFTQDEAIEQSICSELLSAMTLSLKGSREFVLSARWLKPHLLILSTRSQSRFIKLALNSLRTFLLAQSPLFDQVFTENILNEVLLGLINCKFDEIDLLDTYNTSLSILVTLSAIFRHKTASKIRQDTILALMNYLEDESQLEGMSELVKSSTRSITSCIFGEQEDVTDVQLAIFTYICNKTLSLSASRNKVKNSVDYKFKMQTVDRLNSNLSLLYLALNRIKFQLNESGPLICLTQTKLCPLLHQVLLSCYP